ncbi:TPA: hypothetical protein ACH3X2_013458 [Trebouxia sp. C0005]
MKVSKSNRGFSPGGRKQHGQAKNASRAAYVLQPDSDDDLDDILPGPAVTAGSSAYEALLGGLDSFTASVSNGVKPKASKVKAQLAAAVGAQQRQDSTPAEPPLDDADHAASSSDDVDDRSAVGMDEALPSTDAADQVAADFFSQQFAESLAEPDRLKGHGSSAPVWIDDSHAHSAWPNASWVTMGTSVPQVYDRLGSYGVKARLQTLWRDAHSKLLGADKQGQSQNTYHTKKKAKPFKAARTHAKTDAAASEDALASSHMKNVSEQPSDFVNAQQQAAFAVCNSYMDLFLPNQPYPVRSGEDPVLDACLLHCINHCSKTAELIKKTNQQAKTDRDFEAPRDQGFTRPKVLILLPMRNMALKVILRLLQFTQKETRADSIQGKQRFLEDFGPGEDASDEEELTERGKRVKQQQPADHQALFDGNCDDHFRIGMKITRGSVRLYSDFYESDIIVASPLALATKLTEDEEEGGAADFLSSIEVLLVDRLDVLQMQNWAHMTTVLEAVNQVPQGQHGVDIMRVREWYLSGHARQHRQTILLSSFATAEANALFNRMCVNHAGKARLKVSYKGVLGHTLSPVRQLFERIASSTAAADAESRFQHFKKHVWLRIKESGSSGQLVFVRSYFDFVRLRNFLKEEGASFVGLCEYTKHSDVSRGRSNFFHGRRHIMLYTERAHFYHRYRLRGIKVSYLASGFALWLLVNAVVMCWPCVIKALL